MVLLSELVEWERTKIGVGAAAGEIDLAIGKIGSGQPIALVTAGIHGDEGPWGALAIHKLLRQTSSDELIGTLRIVPNANPLAMEADARNAPLDTLDLNRSFPGNTQGSHTERLAAAIVNDALKDADVVIDLHGGGSWCVNAFAFQFPGGEALSQAFNAPFLVNGPDRSVTLTGYARSLGATVTAVEMGGRSGVEEQWADRIAAGLRRALDIAGVLKPVTDKLETTSVVVGQTTVLRPNQGGIFMPEIGAKSVGTIVKKGTELGYLLDPNTHQVIQIFQAPFEQTALLLLRPMLACVEGGAMTYVVAEPID